ncbi:GxxExxY protein [Sphingorhabdus sp.]|jgi:GxxExxY protein|uniref:GxxExxY protein n=1 Tax=Sphingorhabdus sp. TaxID=1902408 RepID=UPI002FDAA798|nr:GxxExxY protein [Sphingomonadaceae bacterium]
MEIEHICSLIVDAAFKLHKDIGPGLLESAYETILAAKLEDIGLVVDRQVPIDIQYEQVHLPAAFRVDLLIDKRVIIEIKSVEKTLPVHAKQVITYLRLTNLTHGFVINFGTPMFKDGIKRLLNDRPSSVSSCLRANQNGSGS